MYTHIPSNYVSTCEAKRVSLLTIITDYFVSPAGTVPVWWFDDHYLLSCTVRCRFDADLNAAKDESSSEVQAKAKLAREKEQLQNEISELKEKVKVCVCVCVCV